MSLEVPRPLQKFGIYLMEKARRTEAVKLLPSLLESQWWDPTQLELLQNKRLADLGKFCRQEVPYYQELFDRLGVVPEQRLTPDSLTALPLMDKETIRDADSKLHSKSWQNWQPRRKSTSGSTGIPLNYYLDRPSHSYQWAHLWRGWQQIGYSPGDQYATLSGGSLVPEKVDLKQKIYLALSGAIH